MKLEKENELNSSVSNSPEVPVLGIHGRSELSCPPEVRTLKVLNFSYRLCFQLDTGIIFKVVIKSFLSEQKKNLKGILNTTESSRNLLTAE